MNLAWFASGALVIGAFVSVFRPDNTAFPVALDTRTRAAICAALAASQGCLQAIYGGASWQEAVATALATALTAWAAHGARNPVATLLLLGGLTLAGTSCLPPSKVADIEAIVGCVLVEAAKTAPGRLPTVEECAVIAMKCGAKDADEVRDLVFSHRVASRIEGGR